jgi:hypothetical protein
MKHQLSPASLSPRAKSFARLPAVILLLLAIAAPFTNYSRNTMAQAIAADPAPPIKVTLDLHDTYHSYPGKWEPPTLREEGGHFHVLLENTSNQPIWLAPLDDEYYPNLSIEITGEDGKTASFTVAMYADVRIR